MYNLLNILQPRWEYHNTSATQYCDTLDKIEKVVKKRTEFLGISLESLIIVARSIYQSAMSSTFLIASNSNDACGHSNFHFPMN